MLITNYDFEHGSIGWIAPQLQLFSDATTPSGRIHAKVSGRSTSNDGLQQNIDLSLLDGSNYVEIAYWAKLTATSSVESRHQNIRAKINCFTNDGSPTQYLA